MGGKSSDEVGVNVEQIVSKEGKAFGQGRFDWTNKVARGVPVG